MLAAVNFHYIRENFDAPYPSIFGVTPEKFKSQLSFLATIADYISGEELIKIISEAGISGRKLMVTFDDGLREQYELALPLLEALHIPAVFYINTSNLVSKKIQLVHKIHLIRSQISAEQLTDALAKFIDIPEDDAPDSFLAEAIQHYKYDNAASAKLKFILNFKVPKDTLNEVVDLVFKNVFGDVEEEMHDQIYMSEAQIADLRKRNFLGSHGHNHFPIGTLEKKAQEFEVGYSQHLIEKFTGSPTGFFSFPYGSKASASGLESILSSHGFKTSFTMERAVNHKISNPFMLSRFDNNDMPEGKNYKFSGPDFYEFYPASSW